MTEGTDFMTTHFDAKDYVAFTGILVTLILGVYNAVQNYRTSRRTIFINTVTAERIKWIGKLRENISTFCGVAHYWRFSTQKGSTEELKKIEEIDKLRHLIALQLNPKDQIDQKIQNLVGEIVSMSSGHIEVSPKKYRDNLDELIKETQELLKTEWEKVKDETRRGDF